MIKADVSPDAAQIYKRTTPILGKEEHSLGRTRRLNGGVC